MNIQDDIYTGPAGPNSFMLQSTSNANPTRQFGAGPLGRVVFRNIQPAAFLTSNVAAVQAPTINVPLALVAGAGTTLGLAPDGSGLPVIVFDVPRCVSLTSGGNLSATNFLITAFDEYGQKWTQLRAGPNINTVNTLKAAKSVLSIVPSGGSATTLSAGTSDIFGLPFRMIDASYIMSAKWDATLAQNAGTFVAADQTSPATSGTGDPRGTFAQAGNASNGTRRLLIAMHIDGTQCGADANMVNAIGVTPV